MKPKNLLLQFTLFILISISIQNNLCAKPNKIFTEVISSNNNKINPITDFFDWLTDLVKPVHGKFTVNGKSNGDAPLAMFNKQSYIGMLLEIESIINLITDTNSKTQSTYKDIYKDALITDNLSCGEIGVCKNAARAKNAAFVYLLGVDKYGDSLDGIGDPGRDFFRVRAIYYLKNLDTYDGRVPILDWGRFSYNKQQYRSKEIIEYLSAYDLLRTGKAHLGLTLSENDEAIIRNNLVVVTRTLYHRSKDLFSTLETYSNYSLMTCAALGMAACILHDKTTYLWEVNSKPERWANAANAYINQTIFGGSNNINPIPMSSANAHSGYAEGPHYFAYAFENLLPYFQVYNNFLQGKLVSEKYKATTFSLNQEKVYNYFKDDRYKRIYEWYRDITQPNGEQPTYDDTWIGSHKDMLALTRDYELNMNPSIVKDIKLGVSMDLKSDWLATRTPPAVYTEMKEKDICYPEAGNAILRTSTGDELKDQHYIHLLGERRESLNGGVPHSLFGIA